MVSLYEYFLQDWRAEKHGSEGKRAELRRKTELLQGRVVRTAEHEHVDTCLHSGVRGTSRIIMRKSTMVTFTSGDRHRFEPPRTQTAFIDLTDRCGRKKATATDLARKLQSFGFSDQFF